MTGQPERITVVAMAFNDWPAGGDAFNVVNDPVAWQVVLNSDVPLVVGGATVTRGGLALTRSEAAALVSSSGPVGDYLYSLFVEWLDRQAALVAQLVAPDTWVIWDEVVVAYVLGMARGEEVSRPGLNADLSFSHQETERRMTWITSIDSDRVWRDFTSGWMGTRSGTLLRRRLRAKVPVSSSVDERTACCLTVV